MLALVRWNETKRRHISINGNENSLIQKFIPTKILTLEAKIQRSEISWLSETE